MFGPGRSATVIFDDAAVVQPHARAVFQVGRMEMVITGRTAKAGAGSNPAAPPEGGQSPLEGERNPSPATRPPTIPRAGAMLGYLPIRSDVLRGARFRVRITRPQLFRGPDEDGYRKLGWTRFYRLQVISRPQPLAREGRSRSVIC